MRYVQALRSLVCSVTATVALAACFGGSHADAESSASPGATDSSMAAAAAAMTPGASVKSPTATSKSGAAPSKAAAASNKYPATYRVDFATSKGDFIARIVRKQAPHGADRLYDLVQAHFFDGARFYRVVPGFVVQWGYPANPALNAKWTAELPDDPVQSSNHRGAITFAQTSAPNSRSTQLFVNYADNARLDGMGFAPLGDVVTGMNVVDHLYSGYGETPEQGALASDGNAYVAKQFPKLDYIRTARIVPDVPDAKKR